MMNVPVDDDHLKMVYKEAKADAFAFMKKNAVGDSAPRFAEELKVKMKQRFEGLK